MIYIDSSVALAHLFSEDRTPSPTLWQGLLTASRLLEYEVWNRLHVRGLTPSRRDKALSLLDGIVLIELTPSVLQRALEPFPKMVRTLDALHLSSMQYVRGRGHIVELASYDRRLSDCAEALGFPLFAL